MVVYIKNWVCIEWGFEGAIVPPRRVFSGRRWQWCERSQWCCQKKKYKMRYLYRLPETLSPSPPGFKTPLAQPYPSTHHGSWSIGMTNEFFHLLRTPKMAPSWNKSSTELSNLFEKNLWVRMTNHKSIQNRSIIRKQLCCENLSKKTLRKKYWKLSNLHTSIKNQKRQNRRRENGLSLSGHISACNYKKKIHWGYRLIKKLLING